MIRATTEYEYETEYDLFSSLSLIFCVGPVESSREMTQEQIKTFSILLRQTVFEIFDSSSMHSPQKLHSSITQSIRKDPKTLCLSSHSDNTLLHAIVLYSSQKSSHR
jgi:hypothetical protein